MVSTNALRDAQKQAAIIDPNRTGGLRDGDTAIPNDTSPSSPPVLANLPILDKSDTNSNIFPQSFSVESPADRQTLDVKPWGGCLPTRY